MRLWDSIDWKAVSPVSPIKANVLLVQVCNSSMAIIKIFIEICPFLPELYSKNECGAKSAFLQLLLIRVWGSNWANIIWSSSRICNSRTQFAARWRGLCYNIILWPTSEALGRFRARTDLTGLTSVLEVYIEPALFEEVYNEFFQYM